MDGQEFINRIRAAAYGRSEPDPLGPARDRYSRPRLEPGSRTRSTVGQVAPMLPLEAPPSRAQQRAEYDAAQRSATRPRAAPAYQPPSNQFAEAGQYALEQTGLPAVRRSARGFASGDMETGIEEGAMGALGVGTLLVGGRGARSAPDAPPMRAPQPPTRIYRGIVPDESRRSALGDRWWSDNPETASTYAPATADGAHVVPGLIDESGFLAVEAPPGTMFRSIPVSALPPEIRRAFPRTTQTVSTHEVAAAAESQGYRGVTFSGIRDGGYGGSAEPYGGFQTGDDGRVIAVFDDSTVQSPFQTGGALRPPPRELGTASDGSVMPVRPPEPFRQSMVGGGDDLAEAARPGALRPAPDGSPPRPQPSDGGSPEVGRPLARLREQGFDTDAPLYRGHDGDPSTGHWRASEGMNGEGVYMTRDPASAERWALRQAENEPTVHAIYARGRIADSRDGLTFEEAREQGYSGLDYYQNGQYVETVIFDPINVSPSVSRRALSSDGGSQGAGALDQGPIRPDLGANDRGALQRGGAILRDDETAARRDDARRARMPNDRGTTDRQPRSIGAPGRLGARQQLGITEGYTRPAYERLVDELERIASENGGRLPPQHLQLLADRTGYQSNSLNVIMTHIRAGRYGDEIAARARAYQGAPGQESVNRDFIAQMMARTPDLGPQQILERLNVYRAERGLKPTTINTVRVTMSGIRKRRADTLTPAFGAPRPQAPDGGSQGAGGSLRNSSDPLGSIAAPGRTRPTGSITDDPSGIPPEGLDTTPSVSDPVEMRMERARRMGFDVDTPLYHGTNQAFSEFSGDQVWLTDNAAFGSANSARMRPGMSFDTPIEETLSGANVIPAFARGNVVSIDGRAAGGQAGGVAAAVKEAFENGAEVVRIENMTDSAFLPQGGADALGITPEMVQGQTAYVVRPTNIRSRFAAFDPARSNSRDLLAGIAAPAAVGGALSERRRQ